MYTCVDGTRVNDVHLPPWAHNSPIEFITTHAAALESDVVSASLHLWIDLIFGASQQGAAAHESSNLFYYLTYYGRVDLAAISVSGLLCEIEEGYISFSGS